MTLATISAPLAFGGLSMGEILIIAAVVMVLFGSTAIPKFARSLGQAKAEFEKGAAEGKSAAEKTPDAGKIASSGSTEEKK